jgi:hypothetical protein
MTPTQPERALAGELMIHPIVAVAVALLLVNDHVLKALWPGALTGKLSDIAGMIFFPLFLLSVQELLSRTLRRTMQPSRRQLAMWILIVGIGFTAVNIIPIAGDWYRWTWGVLGSPLRGSATPVVLTQDVGDLAALPFLGIAWLVGAKRVSRAIDSSDELPVVGTSFIPRERAGRESNPQPSDP